MTRERDLIVLGGGLAGLTAAFRALEQPAGRRPRSVTVLEKADVLGGKARSLPNVEGLVRKQPVAWTDKGYHIFPFWYWDLWEVLRRAGVVSATEHSGCTPQRCVEAPDRSDDLEGSRFTCPHRSASKDYTIVKIHPDGTPELADTNVSWRMMPKLLPVLAVMAGLVGADTEQLDNRSLEDHLLGRWYAGDVTRERVREIVLKALANPSNDASALTTANTYRRWLPTYRKANWRAPTGPMQLEMIDPFVAALRERGAHLRTGVEVRELVLEHGADGARAVSLRLGEAGDDHAPTETVDLGGADVIATLPAALLAQVVSWAGDPPPLDPLAPGGGPPGPSGILRDLNVLDTEAMAALDLYVSELPDIAGEPFPHAHVSFKGSRFATTGFAASREWRPHYRATTAEGGIMPEGATDVVQFVCSDVRSLRGLDDETVHHLLREDIGRFIPELGMKPPDDRGVVVEAVLLRNDEPHERLTMNDAGSARYRPWAAVGVDNLWVAGDYCHCPVDVASMEAAVSSGLLAADVALAGETTADPDHRDGFAGARPRIGGDSIPAAVRRLDRVVGIVATVGAAVSFVFGVIGRLVMLPYRAARRHAVQTLYDDPLRRRPRDVAMMWAGLLAVVVVGPLGVILSVANHPGYDTSTARMSDLARAGAPGAGYILAACLLNWVLLMVFAVPVRRFLPWSRQMTAGILLAAVGYLAFPWVRLDQYSGVWLPHTLAALCILVGPNWSVWAAAGALRHVPRRDEEGRFVHDSDRRLAQLRTLANWWRWPALVASVGVLVLSPPGVANFWWQAAAIVVGHLWVVVLAVYLLTTPRRAATVLGPGPDDPCELEYAVRRALVSD